MKQLLNSRYRTGTSDPSAALARDTAIIGGPGCSQSNQTEKVGSTLESLVNQQRYMKSHMANLLKSAENRHRNVGVLSVFLFKIFNHFINGHGLLTFRLLKN